MGGDYREIIDSYSFDSIIWLTSYDISRPFMIFYYSTNYKVIS